MPLSRDAVSSFIIWFLPSEGDGKLFDPICSGMLIAAQ